MKSASNDQSDQLQSTSLSLSSIRSILLSRQIHTFHQEDSLDLNSYYPLTIQEYEVQYFNLTLTPPSRLSNEKLTDWILETKSLRRKSVALYLTGGLIHTNDKYKSQAEEVLELLALKICSLDAAKSFTDGLALLMPTTGASDLFLELYNKYDNDDIDVLGYNDRLLILYTAYCKAHLSTSSTPLFTITVPTVPGGQGLKEAINVAIALCFLIVATCQQLDVRIKQEATILNEYTENIRTIFIEERMESPSIKTIHDMFSDAKIVYSRLISPLPSINSIKSFLFSDSSAYQGWVTICYDAEDHKQEQLWAIVTFDAIYFFDIDSSFDPQYYSFPESYRIHSCLPLQFVNVSIGDGHNHNKLEIWPYNGNILPLIRMSETITIDSDSGTTTRTFHELSKLGYPEKISYHQNIFIEINNSSDRHHWSDKIDSFIWNCRNSQS